MYLCCKADQKEKDVIVGNKVALFVAIKHCYKCTSLPSSQASVLLLTQEEEKGTRFVSVQRFGKRSPRGGIKTCTLRQEKRKGRGKGKTDRQQLSRSEKQADKTASEKLVPAESSVFLRSTPGDLALCSKSVSSHVEIRMFSLLWWWCGGGGDSVGDVVCVVVVSVQVSWDKRIGNKGIQCVQSYLYRPLSSQGRKWAPLREHRSGPESSSGARRRAQPCP